ncbi:hypothetical protein [Deinococcus radiodurans]|nr:hypothetical protein [Deinococcus radiodurans]ANC72891.1 hypothetical protein A2G07_13625 [Deinococcus radiodurans R1 = ATCC 13939 = DSM 20539]QIP30472.1 hypothetical protein HAV23_14610 [Deinococcus radiodurans]UID71610.1 hypothetical protein DRO_A0021 [Deinococcus radiodurans R1 = ATCC 13939 = DSM 20539]UTA52265.1 hypothetical protein MSS93_14755 [Deinococcus radiodurans]
MRKALQAMVCTVLLSGLAGAQQVVMDTRKFYNPIELSANQQARILREVRAFTGTKPCGNGEVRDEIKGSFTRAGAKQTAYLVMLCDTFEAVPMRTDYGRLVVYEGGRIVRVVKNIGDSIGNVGDLNLDGVDDLLFLAAFGPQMGEFSENASVVTLAGGTFRTFLDLSEAFLDTCDSGKANSSISAHRVTVQKGVRPLFTDTLYLANCNARSSFRPGVQRRIWSDVK